MNRPAIAVLFLALVGGASGLQLRKPGLFGGGEKKDKGPEIDVYVINLGHRKDRCYCMAKQLNGMPANMYRHEASGPYDCNTDNFEMANHNLESEKSLWCSNRKIWERASWGEHNKSKAEFILVLEDDAILKPEWFEKIQMVTKCKEFNFLNIDTFGGDNGEMGGSWQRDGSEDICNLGEGLDFMNNNGWGATAMLIRKSFLPDLLKMADEVQGAMDRWVYLHMRREVKAFRWQPQILAQFRVDPGAAASIGEGGCEGGYSSNIGFRQQDDPKPESLKNKKAETEMKAQMRCE